MCGLWDREYKCRVGKAYESEDDDDDIILIKSVGPRSVRTHDLLSKPSPQRAYARARHYQHLDRAHNSVGGDLSRKVTKAVIDMFICRRRSRTRAITDRA